MDAQTLPEALAREIARVTEIRGHYAELVGMPGVNVAPVLVCIDADLENAKQAAGSPDIVQMMRALKRLQENKE